MNNSQSMIFMVGYPRSGTTLAQTIVMGDPEVFSVPETHIFSKGIKPRGAWRKFGSLWTSYYCYKWMKENFGIRFVCFRRKRKAVAKVFLERLAQEGAKIGRAVLLEKTPAHLYSIDVIRSLFPYAKFIHVQRQYQGALPSFIRAAEQWGGSTNIHDNYKRWVNDSTEGLVNRETIPSYEIVHYEDLVSKRDETIRLLNEKLQLKIQKLSDLEVAENARRVVSSDEKWKASNLLGRREMDSKISEIDITCLHKISADLAVYLDTKE